MGARKSFPGYFGRFGSAQGRRAVAEGQLPVAGPARNLGHSRQTYCARSKSRPETRVSILQPWYAVTVGTSPSRSATGQNHDSDETLLAKIHPRRYIPDMQLAERITFNPNQCGGRPCIRGMRIRVKDVLDLLAAGVPETEILEDYPYLEADDIRACLEYAARELDHPVLVAAGR